MTTRRARASARLTPRRLVVGLGVATLAISVVGSPVIVAGATGVGVALKMGVQNTVSAATTLTATTTGFAFTVKNLGNGGGLQINVKAGKSPISVSAGAGKATNLDADKLDGKDGAAYQPAIGELQDLNALPCTAPSTGVDSDGLLLVAGPEDLLECIKSDQEPNNTPGTATTINNWMKGHAGGPGGDDWYTIDSPGCSDTMCQIFAGAYGEGVRFELYRNGTKIADVGVNFQLLDPYTGDVPSYQIKVSSATRLPYSFF